MSTHRISPRLERERDGSVWLFVVHHDTMPDGSERATVEGRGIFDNIANAMREFYDYRRALMRSVPAHARMSPATHDWADYVEARDDVTE